MLKFLAKFGMKRSEEEIKNILSQFETGDNEQNGIVVGHAALIHYALSLKDPEFSKLVNSQIGENQGPISQYIIQLNKLLSDFHKAGQFYDAAGVKLWNITFRCMSNNGFKHHGDKLWDMASKSFDEAKIYLEELLEEAESNEHEQAIERCQGALSLYDYIPLQFR